MNYSKYCGPSAMRPARWHPGEMPPLGAHLITPWLGYTHHGIYVGDGKVVHYGALMYDLIRKPVEEVSLAMLCRRAAGVRGHACGSGLRRRGSHSPRAFAARRETLSPAQQQLRALRRVVPARRTSQLRGGDRAEFPRWFGERILAALVQSRLSRRQCPANPTTVDSRDLARFAARHRACDAAAARALRRRMSSKRCWVLVGRQLRRSVRPIGRTTLPAGWGSATSKPACIS